MPSNATPVLEIPWLRVRRGSFHLSIERLGLERGLTVLAGPNGAGKSTLLEALAALLPFEGTAMVCKEDVRSRRGRRLVSFLPQQPAGLGHLRLADALAYAAAALGADPQAGARAAEELGVGELLGQRLDRLSGGQRRLAYLAVALVHQPALVLLDEPTTGLDAPHRASVRMAVRALAPRAAVVFTTHLPEDLEHVGERVLVLRRGGLAFDGTPDELRRVGKAARLPGASAMEAALTVLCDGHG